MDNATIERLEASFRHLASRGEELVEQFYSRLFAENPHLRAAFPESMADQKRQLLASLTTAVRNLRTTASHHGVEDIRVDFGTKPEHVVIARDTMVYVMEEMAGRQWNEALTEDWTRMLDGMARGARHADGRQRDQRRAA